jgi:renalase
MRIAVVGAGIAGVACARALVGQGHEVVVLDRGKVPGGRMASRRFDGRYVDLGASYFTVSDPAFGEVVGDWEARGLARPWTDTFAVHGGTPTTGPERWAAAGGIRSLVVDLASELEIRQQTTVQQVTSHSVDGEEFDRVVLAMPTPEAARLTDHAGETEWEPVLVLAGRWAMRTWDWDGLFVNDSDVVAWIADDGSRRGDGAAVLTAHSTPDFARTRLAVPADAEAEFVAGLEALGLDRPAEVYRVQRWTHAKPVGAREELYAVTPDGIGLCGDGFGQAKVETAWRSGTALALALG